jgi:hypothetical protein
LLKKENKLFFATAEETFDTRAKVVRQSTTASIKDGNVFLGKTNESSIELSSGMISYAIYAPKGIISKAVTESTEALKNNDGVMWNAFVYTDYEVGEIALELTIELPKPTTIKRLELIGPPVNGNSDTTVAVFSRSPNGKLQSIAPGEEAFRSLNTFLVNKDEVASISIVLKKSAFDTKTDSGRQSVYVFSLDQLVLYGRGTEESLESVLVCGPYSFLKDNTAVKFQKAQLFPCEFKPKDTSISYFLSDDGTNFLPWTSEPVHFQEETEGTSAALIEELENGQSLIADPEVIEEAELQVSLSYEDEAIVNKYIDPDEAANVPLTTLLVKRGILTASNRDVKFFNATSGWRYKRGIYYTCVVVKEGEGKTLDFGPNSIRVNGVEKSGLVTFPQGINEVGVYSANWKTIEPQALTEVELEQEDSLYPYNHKYLLQGYQYAIGYTGEKIYNGFDEMFAVKMDFVYPEIFAVKDLTEEDFYSVFTVEEEETGSFIKVKIDRSSQEWVNELISVSWSKISASRTQLWVKAILRTTVPGLSPRLESFKLQVG